MSQIKDRQAEEKRRVVQLTKQIAATETDILNSQGYTKIVEAESQHKALLKEIKEQLLKNQEVQMLNDKYNALLFDEKEKTKIVQDKHSEYK